MATEKLEIQIGADIVEVTRSIDQLERELQGLGKSLRSAVPGTKAFNDLAQAFTKQQAVIAAVNKEIAKTAPTLKGLAGNAGQATQSLTNFSRVVQDAPFGIIGIANNIDPLIQSFTQLRKETGSAKAAFAALGSSLLGGGGLALAVSLVTSGLVLFAQAKQKAAAESKKLKEEEDVFVETLAKEKVRLDNLFAIATAANVPLKARTEAIKELRQNYGAYLKDFSDEEILAGKAASAYQRLATALINVARAKAAEAQQIENSKKILDNEGKIAKIREQAQKDAANAKGDIGVVAGEAFIREGSKERQIDNVFKRAREEAEALRKENVALGEEQKRLADAILKNQVEPFKEVKTTTAGIVNNVRSLNVELEKTFSDLSKVVKQSAEIKNNLDPSQDAIQNRPNPINIQRADRTSSVVITPEALRLQGQYALQLDDILEKLRQQQELVKTISDTITGSLNAGIDQFFNAIANNQDPFEALTQSVKRLVVELAAAVVKALILKAVTSALSGGTSTGLGAVSGLFGSSVVRGDQLRLLTFLRG